MAAPRSTKVNSLRAESSAVPRRGRREVTLDDYTGHTAAGAVELARAAGLRPAPERVEVLEAESYGLVVAQDPKAGSSATRGAIVSLYVGAPASQLAADDFAEVDPDVVPLVEPRNDVIPSQPRIEPAGQGAEDELGLVEPQPSPPEVDDTAVVIESPLAPPRRDEAAANEPLVHTSDATSPDSVRRRRRLAAVAALLSALAVTALLSTHHSAPPTADTTARTPKPREKRPVRRRPRSRPSRREPARLPAPRTARTTTALSPPPAPQPPVPDYSRPLLFAPRPLGAPFRDDEFF
jgi:hypothetical protein